MKQYSRKIIFFIIILLAAGFRLAGLHQSFWLDEATQVLAVSQRSLPDLMMRYSLGDFHPPLYHAILWAWLKIFPIVEWSARLPSVFFSMGTVAIVFFWGNSIQRHLGSLAALLLAVSGLHIYYAHDARMYTTAAFGTTLAMWMFWQSQKEGRWRVWTWYVIGMVIGLGSDYLPWFVLPVQWGWAFGFMRRREWWVRFVLTQIILLALMLIWAPSIFQQLRIGSSIAASTPAWGRVVGGFDGRALPLTGIKFLIGRLPIPDGQFGRVILALILLPMVLVFIRSLFWRKRWILFGWLWLVVPIILAASVSFFIPVFSYFRFLFVLPSMMLLFAYAVMGMGRLKWVVGGFLVLVFGGSALMYLLQPQYWREDWRGAVAYADEQRVPVFFPTPIPPDPYTYYSKVNMGIGMLKDVRPRDLDTFQPYVEDIADGYTVVMVSTYLQDISDPRRLLQKSLFQIGFREKEGRAFRGVGTLTRYEREEK